MGDFDIRGWAAQRDQKVPPGIVQKGVKGLGEPQTGRPPSNKLCEALGVRSNPSSEPGSFLTPSGESHRPCPLGDSAGVVINPAAGYLVKMIF